MAQFDRIEILLNEIIDSGYKILDKLDEGEDAMLRQVQVLMDERGNKISQLNELPVEDKTYTRPQKEELKNLFTRFTVLEKQIGTVLAKLSLSSSSTLKDVVRHKKAKKSYKTVFKNSRFLDARVTG